MRGVIGRKLDFQGAAFENTREFAWLACHARRFGFHLSYPKSNAAGIVYEPWHWCWRETVATPTAVPAGIPR
ncbi:MAG: hypothetical protein EXS38_09455 [Opitutus sp.]|nr:hypothetical protein [Opitutus sp.]